MDIAGWQHDWSSGLIRPADRYSVRPYSSLNGPAPVCRLCAALRVSLATGYAEPDLRPVARIQAPARKWLSVCGCEGARVYRPGSGASVLADRQAPRQPPGRFLLSTLGRAWLGPRVRDRRRGRR